MSITLVWNHLMASSFAIKWDAPMADFLTFRLEMS